MNKSNDYILAGRIDPERISTWKRSAEWSVPTTWKHNKSPKDTYQIKTPWKKYKQSSKKKAVSKPWKWDARVSYEEKEYMREQLSQLNISIPRIAERSAISQSSIYAMYTSKGQHIRNRKTMFNKLYKTFWQIKPFNPDQEAS
tara:strand:+ start:532 stop:960 length:429 start_codon:yes stop_codon:yes gene_type:complete